MIIKNFCEKNLSSRSGKVLKYNICESEGNSLTQYGIQIIEQTAQTQNEETIENISVDKNFVNELLLYLCENSVDTVHFKDIVEDYLLKTEDAA